jgi:hypothetical protein
MTSQVTVSHDTDVPRAGPAEDYQDTVIAREHLAALATGQEPETVARLIALERDAAGKALDAARAVWREAVPLEMVPLGGDE